MVNRVHPEPFAESFWGCEVEGLALLPPDDDNAAADEDDDDDGCRVNVDMEDDPVPSDGLAAGFAGMTGVVMCWWTKSIDEGGVSVKARDSNNSTHSGFIANISEYTTEACFSFPFAR